MKKIMLLLMLMVAMPSTAQNTDNLFPKKGYKVKWIKRTPNGFESYACTIRKFEDSDTIYYMTYSPPDLHMTYSPPDLQPYCVCFSLIHQKGAEMIADAMEHRNKSDRIKWIKGYLRYTHAFQVDPVNRYNDHWTYFKPKIQERSLAKNFSLSAAIYAYNRDRAKDARWADTTPEQWLQLYQAAKVVLPLMGAGEDTKTLYDKICTEGGY